MTISTSPPATSPRVEEGTGGAAADLLPAKADTRANTLKLFIAEEQEIWRQAYASFLNYHSEIRLVDATDDTSSERLVEVTKALSPDVMLLGVKTLKAAIVQKLELVREASPDIGLVLLFAFHDGQGITALREFSRGSGVGCAYLFKQTIDQGIQLTQVVHGVADGRVIVDHTLMGRLIGSQDSRDGALRGLSPRALEILGLLAEGYRNETIAKALSLDVKTIERHINSIYSTLDDTTGSKQPRVQAVLMYLRAKGLLSAEHLIE